MSKRVKWRVLDDEKEFGGEGLSTTRKGYEESVGWWENEDRNAVAVDPDALRELVKQANAPEMAEEIERLKASEKNLAQLLAEGAEIVSEGVEIVNGLEAQREGLLEAARGIVSDDDTEIAWPSYTVNWGTLTALRTAIENAQ